MNMPEFSKYNFPIDDCISFRDAFNQLGEIIFKENWRGNELKNGSLYSCDWLKEIVPLYVETETLDIKERIKLVNKLPTELKKDIDYIVQEIQKKEELKKEVKEFKKIFNEKQRLLIRNDLTDEEQHTLGNIRAEVYRKFEAIKYQEIHFFCLIETIPIKDNPCKYKRLIECFNAIYNNQEIKEREKFEETLPSLLRYSFISNFLKEREIKVYTLINEISLNEWEQIYSTHEDDKHPKLAGFIEGEEQKRSLSFYRHHYIKKTDFKEVSEFWLPDNKVGRVESYLRQELGYYPPWLELQIRAMVHFQEKIKKKEKIGINNVINWLKNDKELLKLIKLKKEQLRANQDDIKALTRFLHYSITRKEDKK